MVPCHIEGVQIDMTKKLELVLKKMWNENCQHTCSTVKAMMNSDTRVAGSGKTWNPYLKQVGER